MHHFDGLGDVKTFPVATAECIRASHATNEVAEADVSVFQAGFLGVEAFSFVAGVAKHLDVHGFDHRLGGGFGVANTRLAAAAWNRRTTSGNLLESNHSRSNLARTTAPELRTVHLSRLRHAITHQQAAGVIAEGCGTRRYRSSV